MKAKLGQLTKVLNKSRKGNENTTYNAMWATDAGKPFPMLLTDRELYTIRERAEDHKEDMPALDIPIPKRPSFFGRFFRHSRR